MSAWILLLLAVVALGVVALVWRMSSRRTSLPCPVWLRWLVELDNPFTKVNRAKYIVDSLGLAPGMTVLDAGCGPGRVTVPLARAVGDEGRVVALDVQAGMLARARAKVDAAGLANVTFLEARLGEGKLPREHFDRIVLVTVLGEIPDQGAALVELRDALVPAGVLAIVEVIFDPHFQRRTTVTKLATSIGLRERAFFGHRLAYVLHMEKPGSTG
ncbi:MAG: class I SAM-dependent methyltransferase [Planctomycetota bacterium]|nr:class I SAM-dependent methyltransferase [Planctomycetota bacterium]MCB9826359.1 class I SAM-dependent methyltransferase [Planctomycetota bacterium]MCB9901155.1 class I SAM-dependent methyltransferase [Planctomycetota bacterium]